MWGVGRSAGLCWVGEGVEGSSQSYEQLEEWGQECAERLGLLAGILGRWASVSE